MELVARYLALASSWVGRDRAVLCEVEHLAACRGPRRNHFVEAAAPVWRHRCHRARTATQIALGDYALAVLLGELVVVEYEVEQPRAPRPLVVHTARAGAKHVIHVSRAPVRQPPV